MRSTSCCSRVGLPRQGMANNPVSFVLCSIAELNPMFTAQTIASFFNNVGSFRLVGTTSVVGDKVSVMFTQRGSRAVSALVVSNVWDTDESVILYHDEKPGVWIKKLAVVAKRLHAHE